MLQAHDAWSASVSAFPISQWQGSAWRFHNARYGPLDPGGSLRISGRFNRGLEHYHSDQTWPALYLSLAPEVCMGEIVRRIHPDLLPSLNDYLLSEIVVELQQVLDCRHPEQFALSPDVLLHDTDYGPGQALAAGARSLRAEALLVPSATRLGDNLILFTDLMRPGSGARVAGGRHPRLYVPHR